MHWVYAAWKQTFWRDRNIQRIIRHCRRPRFISISWAPLPPNSLNMLFGEKYRKRSHKVSISAHLWQTVCRAALNAAVFGMLTSGLEFLTGTRAGKALQSVDVPSISWRFCRKPWKIKKTATGWLPLKLWVRQLTKGESEREYEEGRGLVSGCWKNWGQIYVIKGWFNLVRNLQRQKRSSKLLDVYLALDGNLWNNVPIQRRLYRRLHGLHGELHLTRHVTDFWLRLFWQFIKTCLLSSGVLERKRKREGRLGWITHTEKKESSNNIMFMFMLKCWKPVTHDDHFLCRGRNRSGLRLSRCHVQTFWLDYEGVSHFHNFLNIARRESVRIYKKRLCAINMAHTNIKRVPSVLHCLLNDSVLQPWWPRAPQTLLKFAATFLRQDVSNMPISSGF